MSQDKPVLILQRAAFLLRIYAEFGMEAHDQNGDQTPNSVLSYQVAKELDDLALSAIERQGSGPVPWSPWQREQKSLVYPLAPLLKADEKVFREREDGAVFSLILPPLPQAQDAQTGEGSRACGVCGVRDIPFGAVWECWHDGKPCHPACYPINEPPQVSSRTQIPDEGQRPASGSPDVGKFNVRDFGARGDSVTDDSAAVQRAMDAAKIDALQHQLTHAREELYQAQWCDCPLGICRTNMLPHRRCKNARVDQTSLRPTAGRV